MGHNSDHATAAGGRVGCHGADLYSLLRLQDAGPWELEGIAISRTFFMTRVLMFILFGDRLKIVPYAC